MGRRKIEIHPLSDDRNRTVTFVKRKAGLFKKAHELSILCQVDIAVIILGNNNKVYEFSSVDTNDLIANYQKNIKEGQNSNNSKFHEAKSHENYSIYMKKKSLNDKLETKSGHVVDTSNHTDDSEYDSDSDSPVQKPPSKKHKASEKKPKPQPPKPSLARPKLPHIKDEHPPSQRPVLRVQIPNDVKNSTDSAKTLTAMDTNIESSNNNNSSNPSNIPIPQNIQNLNLSKYSNYTSFRSPDSRKPPVLLPIHAKSQSSSPSDVTAAPLPYVQGTNGFFSGLPQASPTSNYPGILPTPGINQFIASYDPTNPQNTDNTPSNSENSTNNSNANSIDSSNTSSNSNDRNKSNAKFRPPLITNFSNSQANPNGEQIPSSGLRNVYEMFPSPSNFYAPQDWPQSNTGMTPIHGNTQQYYMNMLPSGVSIGNAPTGFTPNTANFNNGRQLLGSFPSPLQFTGPGFNNHTTTKKQG